MKVSKSVFSRIINLPFLGEFKSHNFPVGKVEALGLTESGSLVFLKDEEEWFIITSPNDTPQEGRFVCARCGGAGGALNEEYDGTQGEVYGHCHAM